MRILTAWAIANVRTYYMYRRNWCYLELHPRRVHHRHPTNWQLWNTGHTVWCFDLLKPHALSPRKRFRCSLVILRHHHTLFVQPICRTSLIVSLCMWLQKVRHWCRGPLLEGVRRWRGKYIVRVIVRGVNGREYSCPTTASFLMAYSSSIRFYVASIHRYTSPANR